MEKEFNEKTRVQLPALVHLTRLGYKYFGKVSKEDVGKTYDEDTNILIKVFGEQFKKLNPNFKGDISQILAEIKQELNNDDLGQSFYKRLLSTNTKLIDFVNINNNVYHFTAEFTYKNGNDEFRPDITLFINGLPLVFIEVKKPNNEGGIIAEVERMNEKRFPNPKFRRFINITQLMIFSNNMEYSAQNGVVPIEGAFYCTASKNKAFFNSFREDSIKNDEYFYYKNYSYLNINSDVEKQILSDFNNSELNTEKEYKTNLDILTPTNRIITSLCNPERLLFLIKYGIAYVNSTKEVDGKIVSIYQKHIMRYQQMFASFAIKKSLDKGIKSGIIWHTQGSGKTALSFFLVKYLTDYFASKNKVAKFYFIVDRLDLLEQAKQEFDARGLSVKTADNRDELMQQFRTSHSMEGNSGNLEITVVNIQRFKEDNTNVDLPKYATNLQRIFIVDEAHRGYKPEGSFLSNLFNADINSIKIALTGTPLLKEERASWKVFGDYIHTYYYDKSIRDGYTLKIIREDIETSYREKLTKIYDEYNLKIQKKDITKSHIIEHTKYVKELTKYIIEDLKKFRLLHDDNTLGGMVICETSEQAKKIYSMFNKVQEELNVNSTSPSYFRAGLILHNYENKDSRSKVITDFKKNFTIDILIVFNMLLTGFDAPRLKRLYFGRKLKDHTLLQAITRVNRPYKDNKYGFIIDFADIKKNFDETNAAYLEELERFNEIDKDRIINTYKYVLEDHEELISQVENTKEFLFKFNTDNLEIFSDEISQITNKKELLELKNFLVSAKNVFNIVRSFGDKELKEKFNTIKIENISQMISEVSHRINIINLRMAIEQNENIKQIINEAMLNIEFNFKIRSKEELKIISQYDFKDKYEKVLSAFNENIDKKDPEFIQIWDLFWQRFKEKNFTITSVQEYNENLKYLDSVIKTLQELQRKNETFYDKYNEDSKFVRIHKRIKEENKKRENKFLNPIISNKDTKIQNVLFAVKEDIDKQIYNRSDILKQDEYFKGKVIKALVFALENQNIDFEQDDMLFIADKIKFEYLNQYN
ncbi:type I restriction endonuclease subunit R [Mycoplasmopsis gallinarum]|uniref:type I restriction endonuclease subunit R n=1 Tax=Mycoplasmopsis gallinarum TaxID=29557 RepID=UPI0004808DAE|nr:HsdR family type I site-specific deoxyribonuclease [Mycoplasmopsis gallinarum]